MKSFTRYYLLVCFFNVIISSVTSAGVHPTALISNQDSILFDLANSDCYSDKIEFPVYIKSDEDIYGIDFSLKYDINKIAYDSLTILKPYLFSSIYYNPLDSTLRLSCFSIQPIENLTDLFSIRFRKLQTGIDSIGFNNVLTYLNGDECSNAMLEYLRRPAITPPGPLTITSGDSLLLQISPLPGFSYQWSTGDTGYVTQIYGQGVYSVIAENANGCTISSEITIGQGVVLPVELLYFNGADYDDYIELFWATASEQNNDGFRIEKLMDGSWQSIGNVPGHGTTFLSFNYLFRDYHVHEEENYYRLIQVDINGVEYNKGTIHVNHKENISLNVFPNPARDFLNFYSEKDSHLAIYNAYGELVFVSEISKGVSKIELSDFPPGNYFYTTIDSQSIAKGTFIIN